MPDTTTPTVLPEIPVELLDQLLSGVDAKTAFSNGGLLDALKKALSERLLNVEMDHHLASEAENGRDNRRSGTGRKTVLTDTGGFGCAPLLEYRAVFFVHQLHEVVGDSFCAGCQAENLDLTQRFIQ